jgi:hypothetical protein
MPKFPHQQLYQMLGNLILFSHSPTYIKIIIENSYLNFEIVYKYKTRFLLNNRKFNSGVYYFTSVYIHHLVGKFMIMNFHKYNKFNWLGSFSHVRLGANGVDNFAIKLILNFSSLNNEQIFCSQKPETT